jgi:hypothetical protein
LRLRSDPPLLAHVFDPKILYREIVAHTRLILPADYVRQDLAGHCSSLLAKARQGNPYRYGKSTLMDLLKVQANEEPHLRALISEVEKNRRHVEHKRASRRAEGMIARTDYEATANARRALVAEMRARGYGWRALAAEIGISKSEGRRLSG